MNENTLKVLYGSKKHNIILNALRDRIDYSEREMNHRLAAFKKADEDSIAYIKETDADATRRQKRELEGKPQATTIMVPYTYAMHMASLTYWTSVFLGRDPVMQYAANHGEPMQNVMAVEALIAYQTRKGRHLPNLYTWLYDVGKYGISILGTYWDEETKRITTIEEVKEGGVFGVGAKTKKQKTTKEIPGFQGNKTFNIRPHDYRPDPRVPLTDPNAGEFVGWIVDIPWVDVWQRALDGTYIMENVEKVELARRDSATNSKRKEGGRDTKLPDLGSGASAKSQTMHASVPCAQVVVRVVPSQWDLGKSKYPEKWVFTYTTDSYILLEARPLGLLHDRFPIDVLEMEQEGYSMFKRGIYDIGRPMNNLLTWLFNSRMYDVRKSLNGEIVYDPSRLYSKDLLDHRPGKRIRTKPAGYGQNVSTMFTTIQGTSSVTENHLGDAQMIMQLMQQIHGINENIMGTANASSRRSATEIRQSNSASVNRLKTAAEYMSATGWEPFGDKLLQNSQQMYDAEMKLKIVGDQPHNLEDFLTVTPEAIAGDYSYVAVDGTLPVDNMAMINMWGTLLSQLQRIPGALEGYNMQEIVAWLGQKGGLKNIKQFRVQAMDPEQLQQEAQRGNIVPAPGSGGSPRTRGPSDADGSPAGSDRVASRPTTAAQIPGVGSTS